MDSDKIYEIGSMLGLTQNDINKLTIDKVNKTDNVYSPVDNYKDCSFYGTVSINHFK